LDVSRIVLGCDDQRLAAGDCKGNRRMSENQTRNGPEQLTPWEQRRRAALERMVTKRLNETLDFFAKEMLKSEEWRDWADEHRADPTTRQRLSDEADPLKKAKVLYAQIETALAEARRECEFLASNTARKPGRT
jgi:hypothetical protein